MYSLVEWVDEQKYSVIALSRVKETRKDFESYKEGDLVKASCPGFSGIHQAKLIAIRGNTTEDKKALERMAIELIDSLVEAEGQSAESPDKRKKNTSEPRPQKKSKTQEKENKDQAKADRQKKKEDQQKSKQILLDKNKAFLDSLSLFKDNVNSTSMPEPQRPASEIPYAILDLDTQECLSSCEENSPMIHQENWMPRNNFSPTSQPTWMSPRQNWAPQDYNWTQTCMTQPNWSNGTQHNNWTPTPTNCNPSNCQLNDIQRDQQPCQVCVSLKEELKGDI